MREFGIMACFVGVVFCSLKMIMMMISGHEYDLKVRQLRQLKKLYRFFLKKETEPCEAIAGLVGEASIEGDVLKTRWFSFNLKEDFKEKMLVYLARLCQYFKKQRILERQVAEDLRYFKPLIDSMTWLFPSSENWGEFSYYSRIITYENQKFLFLNFHFSYRNFIWFF